MNLGSRIEESFCRPLRGLQIFWEDVIPGLRSLRSLTRGYYLSPLRGSSTQTSALTLCRVGVITSDATQQLVGRARRERGG